MARPDAERVWLGFAQAVATGVLASADVRIDPTVSTWDKIDATTADAIADLADALVDRWRMRFEPDKPAPKTLTEAPDF